MNTQSSHRERRAIERAGLSIIRFALLPSMFAVLAAVSAQAQTPSCPCTIWSSTATPVNASDPDASAIELGVKFTSDVSGYITGIRFYKGSLNTGTHTGSLWSSSGTLLATATFSGESASGWQQVNFSTAVPITANTTYVASYHTTVGHYAGDQYYFAVSNFDNPPLHALASGTSGSNGVYVYGAGGVFPNNSANQVNYWVDVVFTTVAPPDSPPVVSNVAATSITSSGAVITWTTDKGSNSQVSYGTTSSYGSSSALNTTPVTSHSVTLSGLTASTLYHYQARSADSLGTLGTSGDLTFTSQLPVTLTVVSTSPTNGTANVDVAAILSATFNEPINSTTINATTIVLRDSTNTVVPSSVTYNTQTNTANIAPNNLLVPSQTFTVTILSGAGGVHAQNGDSLTSNYAWSFTTGNLPGPNGQWFGPYSWPGVAVNQVLLGTGQVMVLDGNNGVDGGLTARLWDPVSNTFTSIPNNLTNLFCSGHAPLADGRIVVIGGHMSTAVGLSDSNLFDPSTSLWTSLPPMASQRWYPTATTLPDGRVLAMSGTTNCADCFAVTPEVYSADTNTWTRLQKASQPISFYPFNFVLPDGRIFNAGTEEDVEPAQVLDLFSQHWTVVDPTLMNGGSAVMYQPGKIMKAGRHYDFPSVTPYPAAVADTSVIDMTAASPQWQAVVPMHYPRIYATLTILPDGTVLETGGGGTSDPCDTSKAVLPAELWSPVTQTWTVLSSMQTPRLYHSTALLLPNGQVVVAGGGRNTPCTDYTNAEIFSPPYLYNGPRPTITSAPSTVQYGSTFTVSTPAAANVARVTLVRLGEVTHAFNQNQRFLELSFQTVSGGLNVVAPADNDLAPPGQYMLFLLSTKGVPSIASFISFPTPLSVTNVTPLKDTAKALITTTISVAFNAAMDQTTITPATVQVYDSLNNAVAGSVSYDAASRTATLVPSSSLAYSTTYTATIKSGAGGVKDGTGRTLGNDFKWTFTTTPSSGPCPCNIWLPTDAPGTPSNADAAAVEVGVKFSSEINGYVTGIRFYKGSLNTGTHTGSLWTSGGTLLATASFSGETASGWQEVHFSTPVAITASTIYVASYHTTSGHYSSDSKYFATGFDNPPLHALANGASGGNGVYIYGASAFPSSSSNSSNYWVDVIFKTTLP